MKSPPLHQWVDVSETSRLFARSGTASLLRQSTHVPQHLAVQLFAPFAIINGKLTGEK
jgi:hypothetical protein